MVDGFIDYHMAHFRKLKSPTFMWLIRGGSAPLRVFGAVVVMVGVGACSSVPRIVTEYRIDVQQGNVVSQDMVSQLKVGLTKDQVRFVLGTPLLTDIFHGDRWDYIYRLEKGRTGAVEQRNLSVFFDQDGKLSRIGGDVVPALPEPDGQPQPDARMRVIDLGSVTEGSAPPLEEKGFFGRMRDKIGF